MYHVIGLKQTRGIKNVILKAAKNFVGVAVYWEERHPHQAQEAIYLLLGKRRVVKK